MNTLLVEFTEYNEQNLNKVLNVLKSYSFIRIKENKTQKNGTKDIFMHIEEIKSKYPNQWILLAEPKTKDGELKGGIVLFHHSDKKELANANKEGILTKKYKRATHFYTGTLPKISKIGLLKQSANEKI